MKNAKKITSILIIASITMVMFAGCGSKNADTSATSATTATTTTTTTTTTKTGNKKFDPAAMKTLYSNTLKSLVTAGTITQVQSDKVLEAVTKNVPKGTGTKQPTDTTNQNSANKPTGTKPRNNRLSELITSGVITQVQADTINQKIQEAMKNSRTK